MCLSKWIFILCFGYTISKTLSGKNSKITGVKVANPANTTHIDEEVVLDYFFGNQSDPNEDSQNNLDISMMGIDTAKKLFLKAQKRISINGTGTVKNIGRGRKPSDEAYRDIPFFITKALDLMKQSIYATRYRLQETRRLRKKYTNDPCYSAAILYGSLMQLRIKLDNAYMTLKRLHYTVKFIWYLNLYERILALNMDVIYIVEHMFKLKAILLSTMHGR
ncbi:uncharacterized protein LOC124536015 [Vanessa cardui]|uniref:uncharacterized protein LOC124536015 n=1 Tax=Vanessa cardui TaxID=171605 RepID=UPI001F132FFD|nr:uncharacterized protein LOC124536015 [Vanessa cardui]